MVDLEEPTGCIKVSLRMCPDENQLSDDDQAQTLPMRAFFLQVRGWPVVAARDSVNSGWCMTHGHRLSCRCLAPLHALTQPLSAGGSASQPPEWPRHTHPPHTIVCPKVRSCTSGCPQHALCLDDTRIQSVRCRSMSMAWLLATAMRIAEK